MCHSIKSKKSTYLNLKIPYYGFWNEDGRVEGCALTPSCKNTRITASSWTIIERKTLELTKKRYPKDKGKATMRW